jgi:hypothetical protein
VSFFPASVNSDNAAVLKVDVISPALEEINLAMEQHANCTGMPGAPWKVTAPL